MALPELTIQAARDIVAKGVGEYVFECPADNNVAGRQRTRVATALKSATGLKYRSKTDRANGRLTIFIEPDGSGRTPIVHTADSRPVRKAPAKKRSPRKVIAGRELPAEPSPAPSIAEPVLIERPTSEYTAAVLVGATGVIEADPEVLVVHTVDGLYSNDIEAVQRIFDAARKIPTATGKSIASAAYQRIGVLLGY